MMYVASLLRKQHASLEVTVPHPTALCTIAAVGEPIFRWVFVLGKGVIPAVAAVALINPER